LAAEGKPHRVRQSSLLPFASHFFPDEPQTSIGQAQEFDLVAGELGTAKPQLGDRFHPVERKFHAQGLIGEQLVNHYSNAHS
jgi:hypothetical protein